jgi:photosystem II stability/assembly factor-like uncharacterized protein
MSTRRQAWRSPLALLVILLVAGAAGTQDKPGGGSKEKPITEALFAGLEWRNIGPADMVGRISDIEGVPGNPAVVYVGTASGGLWKTTDAGVTWRPIFDGQTVASIGDIALEPGNPDVIYIGTGEGNPRNSVSFGNGIYKSTDGGATWTHLGLEDTRTITRIVVSPKNPAVVYVGALGHVFGPNKDRGVFLSRDGGLTWDKVLYLDERHGAADLDIDPQNPNIVYAALWRFERKPWTFTSGSEEGGLFRSVDGGRTWKKTAKGLPKLIGRIGVKVAPSNPQVVYAMTESQEGTLYRSEDKGETFQLVSKDREIVSRGFYYTDLRVDPQEENRVYALASRLSVSGDGGQTFRRISSSTHVDFHALWIDPLNPARMWQGQDGGIAVSYNRGQTWQYVNNIPVGQFYQIYADNREPFYYVGGGLQDNGTWYGPSRNKEIAGIMNDDWRMISFGDGFHIVVHPEYPDLFLSESQAGNVLRTDMRTREQQAVSPQPRRADGAPGSELKYRFNWNAPLVASPHDPETVYLGGNVVFKSTDFGSIWKVISPDLTTNNPEKQKSAGGPAGFENTGAENHCTIISLKESPSQPGLIWAGTDDGNVQLTQDGGKTWQNVTKNVIGLPPLSPVSAVEPSWTEAGTAYCAFDRHMLDDLHPYIFKTRDFGKTWTNITGNLPDKAFVWVVREDLENPNLVLAGTELGLFASFSGGTDWIKLHLKNLPPVAVHDILIHLRDNDLILGTHGRSLWILDDITPLQELNSAVLDQLLFLFDIRPAIRFSQRFTRYGIGDAAFLGPNPPYGALITYYLKEKPAQDTPLKLEILDGSNKKVRTLAKVPAEAGLNRIAWDLRTDGPRLRQEPRPAEDVFQSGPRGAQVPPGTYAIRISAGSLAAEKTVEVGLDPSLNVSREDLRLQHRTAVRLLEMQSILNEALRLTDGLKSQVEERKKTMQALGRNVKESTVRAVDSHLEKITALQKEISRSSGERALGVPSGGPRVLDRVSSLLGAIDGLNAAPTQAQVAFYGELVVEFREALDKVNEYLSDTAKELNSALESSRIPPVLVPEPLKIPDLDKL